MRYPEFRIDSLFAASVAAAVVIGLANLYSASAGAPDAVFPRQMAATAAGGAICLFLAAIDYRFLRRYSFALYAAGTLVLFGTALFGHEVKATRAWISAGPVSIQPSELFKCVFILHLAAHFGKIMRERKTSILHGLIVPVIYLAVPVALILRQGDAGTAAVYLPIFFVMLYAADLRYTVIFVVLAMGAVAGGFAAIRIYSHSIHHAWEPFLRRYLSPEYSLPIAGVAAMAGVVAIFFNLRRRNSRAGEWLNAMALSLFILFAGMQAGNAFYGKLKPHQKTRVASFFQPTLDPRGAGYQSLQSQIAVGSGGIFGKGYMKGSQKELGFLPEQWTDFAFSVLAEEWGFAGSVGTLAIYGILIGSAFWIARNATDLFGSLLATGVATLFFVHMSVGVAMNLGSFPVVGIPMPFLSYGGSAQIANLTAAGLVLSVARHRRLLAA